MKISPYLQLFDEDFSIFFEEMSKGLKIILEEKRKERGISVPKLAKALDIPKDRIYAWYRDNSEPKAEDREKIQKWINGETYNIVGDNRKEEPSPLEILAILAEAFRDQAALMRSIESKMAQESTQASVVQKIDSLDANLIEALGDLGKISQTQNKSIERALSEFAELKTGIGVLLAVSKKKN